MKKAITITLILLAGLMLAGCGKEEEKKGLSYFKEEVLKIDDTLREEEYNLRDYLNATEGMKLSNLHLDEVDERITLEIYFFDKESEHYKVFEKGQGVGVYDKSKDVKNGYVILMSDGYTHHDEVMAIFNKLD